MINNCLLFRSYCKVIILLLLLSLPVNLVSQTVAVKSNLPYMATGSLNVGLEVGLTDKLTLDLNYGINPFVFKDNQKLRHWLVEPEVRYWFCERFYGHFMGLHIGALEYNVSRVKVPTIKNSQNYRYEGWAALGGISYGYSWILGGRWNMEATLGLGVIYTDYKKFECPQCGKLTAENDKILFAPTKAAISIIYLLK